MGVLVQFPKRFSQTGEEWLGPSLTKRQLANALGRSTRWVELRMGEGLPSDLRNGRRVFVLSEAREWLSSVDKSA